MLSTSLRIPVIAQNLKFWLQTWGCDIITVSVKMTSSECVQTLSTTSEQKCAAHIILRDIDLQEVRSYSKYINAMAVNGAS